MVQRPFSGSAPEVATEAQAALEPSQLQHFQQSQLKQNHLQGHGGQQVQALEAHETLPSDDLLTMISNDSPSDLLGATLQASGPQPLWKITERYRNNGRANAPAPGASALPNGQCGNCCSGGSSGAPGSSAVLPHMNGHGPSPLSGPGTQSISAGAPPSLLHGGLSTLVPAHTVAAHHAPVRTAGGRPNVLSQAAQMQMPHSSGHMHLLNAAQSHGHPQRNGGGPSSPLPHAHHQHRQQQQQQQQNMIQQQHQMLTNMQHQHQEAANKLCAMQNSLQQQQNALKSREDELARLQKAVQERDEEIMRLNGVQQKLQKAKESEIASLKQVLQKEKEEKLAKLNAAHNKRIEAREEDFTQLRSQLMREKDKEIAKLSSVHQKQLKARDHAPAVAFTLPPCCYPAIAAFIAYVLRPSPGLDSRPSSLHSFPVSSLLCVFWLGV
eukprot:6182568-Pleurochrysis_carterae.AAC.4